ncbi:hypothetical protein KEM52_006629 [Ascosphaera acerosa]|nr:hypothetical protein KEM52_006629 [Ascosphaera acerosa]
MESPSEASVDSVPIIPINPVNPRACDECRAKKLRCTKELDGCARCKRQKLRCHYSPQKPMGRPRKFYSLSSMSPQNRRSEPQLSNYMSPLFVSESVNSIAAPMAVRNSAMALHNLANAASADLSTTHSSPASSYLDLRVNRRLSPILPKTGCPQCGWPIHAGAYAHQQPTSPSHLERYPADLNR